ncbi:CoA ester lyase [Nakamurella flava]|uniref:CoA ester lyase n=2 Tax=Nakamurella flava TaxID=2576308 RepID=A0A4U6QG01_9ACTN|nr:CoA ester lyase [Nakamurella flava]
MSSAPSAGVDPVAQVAGAVTALFVPGDRPDRYAKAATSGADVVVIDLEDAVAPPAKFGARLAATRALGAPDDDRARALVRVNAADSGLFAAEIEALLATARLSRSGLLGVMLPKSEDPSVVADVVTRFAAIEKPVAVVPLVESARGVLRAAELAAVPGVTRLALGAIDLTVDVGADLESPVVTHAMAHLVLASRAARIAAPLDSPSTAITDLALVGDAARVARSAGFGGKLCIHPRQVAAVRAAFAPTEEQLAWARSVLAAGEAAVQIDGRMIDKPVIAAARRILRLAGTDAS